MHTTISEFLGLMVSLAIGGFDPAPALIGGVFLAAGSGGAVSFSTRRHQILIFAFTLIGGTALWGVVLATTVGARLAAVDIGAILHIALNAGWWTIVGKAVIATAVACVGWYYWRRNAQFYRTAGHGDVHTDPHTESAQKTKGLRGLILTALFFIAIVTTDVPFLAGAIAAGTQPLWINALGNLVWAVISQLPLVVLCITLMFGKAQVFSEWLQHWWDKVKDWFRGIMPTACAVVCTTIIIDIILHVTCLGLSGW
ncbi:hypothetical protein [Corynebacterium anserum]|uniref:Sap, sulfolipid-1-addressing protein n=1 Tax=Corynebacterium anserum TaxID=2684406 RepID=A0A7G7YMT9_9CORY|nr:hypothetical protein [Corynebacterium anserum]QNH95809.1 hypothetical protein GP473_03185 [Corynebacterium anserum]